MSSVRHLFPANRLSEALSKGRPVTVEQCLNQADENLRHIAAACADHVDMTLDLQANKMAEWPAQFDAAYLSVLYRTSVRLIGPAKTAGLHDLDRVAAGFAEVLEGMLSEKIWDRDAVAIHVGALRLLRRPKTLGSGLSDLIAGLEKVRARYSVN